jgi:hypothetical protein
MNKKTRKILIAKAVVVVLRTMRMRRLSKSKRLMESKDNKDNPNLRKKELEESKNMMG